MLLIAPMEKAPRSKGTIVLRYLQKAATFTITNTPHSPRAAAGERPPAITSIIPTEAWHKKQNFNEEPTSPKVTCIGQIKHRKTAAERKKTKKKKNTNIPFAITRILSQRVRPDHKENRKEKIVASPVPALGQLKRFASRRELSTLADFDWEREVAALPPETAAEDGVNIYHSAPLVLGGDVVSEEHKEIGLWRRRSIAALRPIQVNK
ncbi:uncharacterized protein LOC110028142 [Phalaenopsis equestris]|uniref:uncharacterized protein LOC110028142 n=1 Tax=Phalaenopsis equestris TaxID=78828 RepID=UPI0009E29D36|nr:uncharacterized protein LOC110028142 [Phalaenopsis equestris]